MTLLATGETARRMPGAIAAGSSVRWPESAGTGRNRCDGRSRSERGGSSVLRGSVLASTISCSPLPAIVAVDVGPGADHRGPMPRARGFRPPRAVSGAEAAALVMKAGGVPGVAIEPVAGELSDHYDPSHKVLRLSHEVYAGRSLAAVGVAAHEAGHAIQDASDYPGLVVRNLIVPLASIGSSVFWVPDRGRALVRHGAADPAGDHPVLADRGLPAHQPAGRVQRQPPRPADPRSTGCQRRGRARSSPRS